MAGFHAHVTVVSDHVIVTQVSHEHDYVVHYAHDDDDDDDEYAREPDDADDLNEHVHDVHDVHDIYVGTYYHDDYDD